jgi:hypothetical protein
MPPVPQETKDQVQEQLRQLEAMVQGLQANFGGGGRNLQQANEGLFNVFGRLPGLGGEVQEMRRQPRQLLEQKHQGFPLCLQVC